MMAHYLQTSSHNLEELCNLTFLEKCFYIASMMVINEEKGKTYGELALLSNPFLQKKK